MPFHDPRKTKIVCTIGPASESERVLTRLIRAGLNVARLNFSHGTHGEHREKLRRLRAISARLNCPVAVIQDLAGPKIRTGVLPPEGVRVRHGETVLLSGRKHAAGSGIIPVNYPRLAADVKCGDAILLADGTIELRIEKIKNDVLYCRVMVAGVVGTHKGVNIPSESLSISGLTAKDRVDLEFAAKEDIDFVALSFVRRPEDVLKVKRILAAKGKRTPVIAKIEKPQALECIDEIVAAADGIMVARGDLGVEIPLEQVPVVQKMLIRKANQAGKPVITATQMLRSMVDSPRPTRAEVTDVANAIWEGTDAVMLSEETASGHYPVDAVKVMDRIARTVEKDIAENAPVAAAYPSDDPIPDSISYSAYLMVEELQPRAIVTPTRSGATARRISRYRPDAPIIALTPAKATERQLCLTRGVVPVLIPELVKPVDLTGAALTWARKILPLKKGDRIVITAGTSIDPGTTNTIRLEKI
ncbi:MAG TPA: pyruvate kinase [bacterium]|nr:pyruvate kinase [bacterium]